VSKRSTRIRLRRSHGPLVEITSRYAEIICLRGRRYVIDAFKSDVARHRPHPVWVDARKLKRYQRRLHKAYFFCNEHGWHNGYCVPCSE
jgi:hypothetical protein